MDRVSRADASRLGKRSVAIDAVRPREGRSDQFNENIDRSISRLRGVPTANSIYFATEEKSEMPVFSIAAPAGSARNWFWATVSTMKLKSARMVAYWVNFPGT